MHAYELALTNLSIFLQRTQHHNHSTVTLHYHLPEVTTGALHGVLSDNECIFLFVALYMDVNKRLKEIYKI